MASTDTGVGGMHKWFAAAVFLCSTVSLDALGATPEVDLATGLLLCGRNNMNLNTTQNLFAGSSSANGFSSYQSGFDPSTWSGSLKKTKLISDGASGQVHMATDADWDAGEVLTGSGAKDADPDPGTRKIFVARITGDSNAGSSANKPAGMAPFKWDTLSAHQQSLLDASPVDGKNDGLGERRLDYLRGMRNLEVGRPGGIFRRRDRVLGDIINSKPVVGGIPVAGLSGVAYQTFREEAKASTAAVYVGANDGLLHAFDTASGRELFAYIPAPMLPKMNQLTAPGYVHRSYVDGEISIGEARLGGEWKTILTAGMGGGAQGLFALDISNPADFGGGMGAVLDFTDGDDGDIGNLIGAPMIAKFKTKTSNGAAEYKHFIVASSGLNNYRVDGAGKFNAAAPGALFLLSLEKTAGDKWKQDVNYFKFKVPISEPNQQNGLSMPALVIGSDGTVRYAYAGDLQGNLWRFDFTASALWRGALGASPGTPMFVARDSNGMRQPITMQPKVVFAPGGGYVVLFGTGKFIERADATPANFRSQSFYAIYDSTRGADKVSGREQLAPRVLTAGAANAGTQLTIVGEAFRYGVADGSKRGWYFDFVESNKTGERSVSGAVVDHGRLFFNSMIPAGDPCVPTGGRSYRLDALTGLPLDGNATGVPLPPGAIGAPLLLETATVQVGERNAVGRRMVKRTQTVLNFGGASSGTSGGAARSAAQGSTVEIDVAAGRISWREILNWQELRDAAKNR